MGVVDEFVRQENMQQRLDRRCRRHRIEQVGALDLHHVLVGDHGAGEQLAQRRNPDRGQAGWLDRAHVPAGALDAHDVGVVADEIWHAQLDRGIAAAMQHQARVLAEQPGRVNAQRQIGRDAGLCIAIDHRRCVAVAPVALHVNSPLPAAGLYRAGRRPRQTGARQRRRCPFFRCLSAPIHSVQFIDPMRNWAKQQAYLFW